jgi:hypothetical protein
MVNMSGDVPVLFKHATVDVINDIGNHSAAHRARPALELGQAITAHRVATRCLLLGMDFLFEAHTAFLLLNLGLLFGNGLLIPHVDSTVSIVFRLVLAAASGGLGNSVAGVFAAHCYLFFQV